MKRAWPIVLFAGLSLVACKAKPTDDDDGSASSKPSKDKDSSSKDSTTSSSTGGPAPVQTQTVAQPDPATPKPTIEPHVKVELDNKTDGITGQPLAPTGAKASLQGPAAWKKTGTDAPQLAAGDDKAHFVAMMGDPTKLDSATAALGLSGCTWNPPEVVTLGKDKLSAAAADGVCKRGAVDEHVAYVAPAAEQLLIVGGWDPGGDMASIFGSMRSVAKISGDGTGLAACCAALAGNARNAPPAQMGIYMAAAGVCNSMRNNPQTAVAIAQIRQVLIGAQMPGSCR